MVIPKGIKPVLLDMKHNAVLKPEYRAMTDEEYTMAFKNRVVKSIAESKLPVSLEQALVLVEIEVNCNPEAYCEFPDFWYILATTKVSGGDKEIACPGPYAVDKKTAEITQLSYFDYEDQFDFLCNNTVKL